MVLINFYKIISANSPKVYIGSTIKTIEVRLQGHEADFKRFQDEKQHYMTSYEILELKNYSIELIETLECETKDDRDTIERGHILRNLTAVNKQQPGRTSKQYNHDNKQHLNQKHDCPCSGKYSTTHKARHEKSAKHQNYIRNQQPINNNANVINNYFYNNV